MEAYRSIDHPNEAHILQELHLLEDICCIYSPVPPTLSLYPLAGASIANSLSIELDCPLILVHPLPLPETTLVLLNKQNEIAVIQI